MASKPILKGYRVIDFTQYLAGPSATRHMSEIGAEISNLDKAPYGDPSRAFPYRKHKRSAYYVQQNRGKKSLCLNFKDERSREIVRDLITSPMASIGRLGGRSGSPITAVTPA